MAEAIIWKIMLMAGLCLALPFLLRVQDVIFFPKYFNFKILGTTISWVCFQSSGFNFTCSKIEYEFSNFIQVCNIVTWFSLKDNYPKVEYSEAGILHDTNNILHQIFGKKYCKLMQVLATSHLVKFNEYSLTLMNGFYLQ